MENQRGSKASPAFLAQREVLVNDIALAMEDVLHGINKLNRSLEGVIAVGNEFGAVEALWSQFEGVMAPQGSHQGLAQEAEKTTNEESNGDH